VDVKGGAGYGKSVGNLRESILGGVRAKLPFKDLPGPLKTRAGGKERMIGPGLPKEFQGLRSRRGALQKNIYK